MGLVEERLREIEDENEQLLVERHCIVQKLKQALNQIKILKSDVQIMRNRVKQYDPTN